jgi:hypothetical protein
MIGTVGLMVTWFVVAVWLAVGALGLRHIEPNQELEEVRLAAASRQGAESSGSSERMAA